MAADSYRSHLLFVSTVLEPRAERSPAGKLCAARARRATQSFARQLERRLRLRASQASEKEKGRKAYMDQPRGGMSSPPGAVASAFLLQEAP